MTRKTDLQEILDKDILLVNPEDAALKNISSGEKVTIISARGEVTLEVSVTEDVKPGIVFTTFHFPEEMVNQVTSDERDEESLCPEYKIASVDLIKK